MIGDMMKRLFTNEELNSIVLDYNNGYKPKELADKYNRSSGCIINKLKSLGVYKNSNTRLTNDDINYIVEKYKDGDCESIFDMFPSLSKASLQTKMSNLGISFGGKNYWLYEEIEYLRDNYLWSSLEDLEIAFNYRHTQDAIASKAFRYFGYSTSKKWSDEDNELLKKLYPTIPLSDVCNYFPKRSKDSIAIHARLLGLKSYYVLDTYWTDE